MEKKKNTPKLRFPEFTGEWEEKKIQKLIDDKIIISHLDGNHGGLYPRNEEFVSNGIPYITANDFAEGILYFDKCKFLTNERASKFRKGIAINGDVLFAHNATVGPTAILRTNFDYVILSTTATYFRCDNINLLNLYVEKYFNTDFFVNQYTRVMAQSTRNQVPISMQRTFSIKLPTIGEQTKIATFLTAVDEKLTQLKKKKTLLEQYKKGVMQKLFSQELRFKDENNQDFPDWQELPGNYIFKNVSDKNHISELPILAITQEYGAIPRELIDYNITVTDKSVDSYKVVQIGDFIISLRSFQGGIEYSKYNGICSPAYIILRPIMEIEDCFFKSFFKTELYIKALNKNIEGIRDGKMISYKYFSEINLPYPSLPEQQKIATFLLSIDEKINHSSAQIEKMEAWKKGLLQQMFC